APNLHCREGCRVANGDRRSLWSDLQGDRASSANGQSGGSSYTVEGCQDRGGAGGYAGDHDRGVASVADGAERRRAQSPGSQAGNVRGGGRTAGTRESAGGRVILSRATGNRGCGGGDGDGKKLIDSKNSGSGDVAGSSGSDGGSARSESGGDTAKGDSRDSLVRGGPSDKSGAGLNGAVAVISLGGELLGVANAGGSTGGANGDVLQNRSTVARSQNQNAQERDNCQHEWTWISSHDASSARGP